MDVKTVVAAKLDEAVEFLCRMIEIPSLPGDEADAMALASEVFARIADVRQVPMDNSLRDDRDYSDPIADIQYDGRHNLRICQVGSGGGKSLILNSHMDIVPAGATQIDPFNPQIKDGAIFGRGSCDAKGQVATIYLAMAALSEMGVKLPGDVIAHIVAEEENGGNGTVAMISSGEKADAAVVLEPTELTVMPSVRGAVWFRVNCQGKPGHPGRAGQTRSALTMIRQIIAILENYHDKLLAGSRGLEFFDKFDDPMPIVIGQLHAGNWGAAAPAEAMCEGILGILPNKTCAEVMTEMVAEIRNEGGDELADNSQLRFLFRHDPMVTPADHPLVTGLVSGCTAAGIEPKVDGMRASCDSWLYCNRLGVPTVVFGGGSFLTAHADDENMPIDQLASAAEALVNLIVDWCR